MFIQNHTNVIRNQLIQIGDSIWYSTDYHDSEQGMVQYCLNTNKTKQIIKYSSYYINPQYHSVCSYKDTIYIINGDGGYDGDIIAFNPSSKQLVCWQNSIDINRAKASAVVHNDEIHIYNGRNNKNSTALIYNPSNNAIRQMDDKYASTEAYDVCACSVTYKLRTQDQKQLIRFGGYDSGPMDWFLFGKSNMDIVSEYIYLMELKLKLHEIATDIVNMICSFYCVSSKDNIQ